MRQVVIAPVELPELEALEEFLQVLAPRLVAPGILSPDRRRNLQLCCDDAEQWRERRLVGRKHPAAIAMINRRFYFLMSLIITAIVIAGFGPKLDARLLHPSSPRLVILYIHAVVFAGWILFFILQTALISVRDLKTHRKVGWWGAALGVAIPFLGVATAIVVGRVDPHPTDDDASFLFISFHDMIALAITFGLALYWRKRPEYHRRLMLISACILTAAAFGRIIPPEAPESWIYVGVDALILIGFGRDWLTARRLPTVYPWALPMIVLGQLCVLYVYFVRPAPWITVAHRIIG